jgi:hypothetical protein
MSTASIKVTIHSTGKGLCLLSEKGDSDGLTVSFDDGTVQESFLSWKAFRQLLAMKAAQNGKPKDVPVAVPVKGAE